MSRRFQFSLKTLLLALTLGCLCFGWFIERARRRERAIDAIVEAGGVVFYGEESEAKFRQMKYEGHFWRDVGRIPVRLHLDETLLLDASLGASIREAAPVARADIRYPVDDDDLPQFSQFNEGCDVVFWDIRNLSVVAMDKFIQAFPHVNVAYFGDPQAGDPGVITVTPPFTRVYPIEGPNGENAWVTEPPIGSSD